MINSIVSGFLIGLAGLVHCAGMCGPLQLIVPSFNKGKRAGMKEFLSYHSGRIILYAVLGLLSGLLGLKGFIFQSFQWTSIVLGSFMLILAWIGINNSNKINTMILREIQRRMNSSYQTMRNSPSYLLIFNIGILNGLLPCGMVYFALLNALSSESVSKSIVAMIGFGIGTLPIFILLKGVGLKLSAYPRLKIIQPWLLSVVSLMIILRGLNLGIPYLSPKIITESTHSRPRIECCKEQNLNPQKKAD